jgi:hypothetical protein
MDLWSNQLDAERRLNVAANSNKGKRQALVAQPKCQDGS